MQHSAHASQFRSSWRQFAAAMSSGAGKTSKVSLHSVRAAASGLPRARACPWVAQWFTVPQLVVKALQLVVGMVAVGLLFSWKDQGVSIANLTTLPWCDETSPIAMDTETDLGVFRNKLYCYVGLALLSVFYAFLLTSLGLSGVRLPAGLQAFSAGLLLLLWLLGAPVMSASIEQLGHSYCVRSHQLDTLYLEVATGMGFISLVLYLFDMLMGFSSLNSLDEDSTQFASEVDRSKSILSTVRSRRSLLDARRMAHRMIPRVASKLSLKREEVEEEDPAMADTSPLREHDENGNSQDEDDDVMETSV